MTKSALSGQVELLNEALQSAFKRLDDLIMEEKERVNAVYGRLDSLSDNIEALANKVATLERHTNYIPQKEDNEGTT